MGRSIGVGFEPFYFFSLSFFFLIIFLSFYRQKKRGPGGGRGGRCGRNEITLAGWGVCLCISYFAKKVRGGFLSAVLNDVCIGII